MLGRRSRYLKPRTVGNGTRIANSEPPCREPKLRRDSNQRYGNNKGNAFLFYRIFVSRPRKLRNHNLVLRFILTSFWNTDVIPRFTRNNLGSLVLFFPVSWNHETLRIRQQEKVTEIVAKTPVQWETSQIETRWAFLVSKLKRERDNHRGNV